MAFQQIPHSFFRPKVDEEKEKKFNKPPYEVASDFYDEFTGNEVNFIKAGTWGIVAQDLGPAIDRLLLEAAAVKDKDYADLLETFVFDNLKSRSFAYKGVKDYEKFEGIAKVNKDKELAIIDWDIKKEALFNLFKKDIRMRNLPLEEIQKKFESEFGEEIEDEVEEAA